MGELAVPIAHHHVGPAGHAGMHRAMAQKEAENRIMGIGRPAPDRVAGINIFQGNGNVFFLKIPGNVIFQVTLLDGHDWGSYLRRSPGMDPVNMPGDARAYHPFASAHVLSPVFAKYGMESQIRSYANLLKLLHRVPTLRAMSCRVGSLPCIRER